MNTPFDELARWDDRLRETFADIVPQLVARAQTATEIPLLGEPAPARQPIAGTPRRWSILAAAAAVVLFAGIVWVVSRPDSVGPVGPTPSPTASTIGEVPDGAPAWYSALKQVVPERYPYLALVDRTADMAMFEAIDPNSPVLLRIDVRQVPGGPVRGGIVCDDGTANLVSKEASPCSSGPTPISDTELAHYVPADQLLQLAQAAMIGPLDRADIIAAVDGTLNGSTRLAVETSGASVTLLYGHDGAPDTEVHVVSGLYPMHYSGGGSAWALSADYAARATTTLPDSGPLRTLLAYKAVVAAHGQASSVGATEEWYTILRQAVPVRFNNLAVTRVEPHLALFVAFDVEAGEVLDLIVRDVPGPAVEVTCNLLGTAMCAFNNADRDAVTADIPPSALVAAAREAMLPDMSAAREALAALPGWTVSQSAERLGSDITFAVNVDGVDATLRLVGGVLPPTAQPNIRVSGTSVAWGTYGKYAAVVTTTSADAVAYEILQAALTALIDPVSVEPGPGATTAAGPTLLDHTDGFVVLPDGTAFHLYEQDGSFLCVDEQGGHSACTQRAGTGDWPAEVNWEPWSTGMFVYGLLDGPYVVTVTTPSSSVTQALAVIPSQVDGKWICYGVLPGDPHYTVTVSTAAGTIVATQTLH
jgi:hypothetical protein